MCLAELHVRRGGSLVDSEPFVRRVAGSNPALTATYRDLRQVFHSQLPVALWRETPTPYTCCVYISKPSESPLNDFV